MLGPTRCDVSADAAIGQGAEVGLAAVPSIGGSFLGLAAKVLFDPVHERNELVLIAHALRQAMRHDDLGFCIDGGLRVVALDGAVLGQKHAALGIGEVSLGLALGSCLGGVGVLPFFLRPSAMRFFSASSRRRVSSAAAALACASSSALASRIFSSRLCLSATQSGISSPRFWP